MLVVLVLAVSWLAILGCFIALFRTAAGGEEIPSAGWQSGLQQWNPGPDVDIPPPVIQFGRRLSAVNRS
jgi:hypothetical protein